MLNLKRSIPSLLRFTNIVFMERNFAHCILMQKIFSVFCKTVTRGREQNLNKKMAYRINLTERFQACKHLFYRCFIIKMN